MHPEVEAAQERTNELLLQRDLQLDDVTNVLQAITGSARFEWAYASNHGADFFAVRSEGSRRGRLHITAQGFIGGTYCPLTEFDENGRTTHFGYGAGYFAVTDRLTGNVAYIPELAMHTLAEHGFFALPGSAYVGDDPDAAFSNLLDVLRIQPGVDYTPGSERTSNWRSGAFMSCLEEPFGNEHDALATLTTASQAQSGVIQIGRDVRIFYADKDALVVANQSFSPSSPGVTFNDGLFYWGAGISRGKQVLHRQEKSYPVPTAAYEEIFA